MVEGLLNYRLVGKGEPLLLIHGWGVSFTIWRDLEPLLAQQYQLIIPEMPGIGLSPPAEGNYYEACAQSLEVLRVHLGLERWHILGYSLGGWVARTFARSWPSRVNRLVLLCIARPFPPAALTLTLLLALDKRFPAFGNWAATRWRLPLLVQALGFNGQPHPLAAVWTREIRTQSVPVIKQSLHDLPRQGLTRLRLPPLPTLFIWGRIDTIGVAPFWSGDADVILSGGHSLPMTGASQVYRIVRRFLGWAPSP
ncbi:MAG: alpha/beta hydrolase [Spirochaetales bacterium]